MIDPVGFADMEHLRQELIEVIDERLDETELMLFTRADQQFHFARSIIVVFDTHRVLAHPRELLDALPHMSVGTVFYHFVDARRREPVGKDDFSTWLGGAGAEYSALVDAIAAIDPYFESLFVIRDRLTRVLAEHFGASAGRGGHGPAARGAR